MLAALQNKPDALIAALSLSIAVTPIDLTTPILRALNLSYLSPLSVACLSLVISLSGLLLFLRQSRNFNAIYILPIYALIISTTVTAAEPQTIEQTFFWFRIGGAVVGSTVAVLFRGSDLGIKARATMFGIGSVIGYIAARLIIDWFDLKMVADYWLISSFAGGAFGYMAFEIFLSERARKAAAKRLLND